MDVYLKNEKEKSVFHFPINPLDSITINRSKKYDTADIVDYGEVDLSDKGKKIKELSFNTLLPAKYDTYCRYRDIPTEAIAKLEKWMEQQEPLRLIITDFNFNDLVIVSNLSEEERSGELGDKYINLSFRVWRELKIETLPKPKRVNNNTKKRVVLKNNRPSIKKQVRNYTVKRGDCLWYIARRYYGNGAKWPTIYNRNKGVIGKNANKIYPGQKLVIP